MYRIDPALDIEFIYVNKERCLLIKYPEHRSYEALELYMDINNWNLLTWLWDVNNKNRVIILISTKEGGEVITIRPKREVFEYPNNTWLLTNKIEYVTTYPNMGEDGLPQIHIPVLKVNLKPHQ